MIIHFDHKKLTALGLQSLKEALWHHQHVHV